MGAAKNHEFTRYQEEMEFARSEQEYLLSRGELHREPRRPLDAQVSEDGKRVRVGVPVRKASPSRSPLQSPLKTAEDFRSDRSRKKT